MKLPHHRQYWFAVTTIYMAMFAMGIVENVRSVGFAVMKSYFNASYDQYGIFTTCLSFAYILACFIASFLLNRVHFKWIYGAGYVAPTVFYFLTTFTKSFVSAGSVIFLGWMALGLFTIVANATATIVFQEHRGTMMSMMHFCYGIGAIFEPNISRWALQHLHNGFYSIFLSNSVVLFVLFVVFLFIPLQLQSVQSSGTAVPSKSSMTVWEALKMPSVWLCAVAMAMIQTVENSCANWASLYIVDVLGYSVDVDVPNYQTIVYAVFTTSRLISGPLIDRAGYYRYIYICLGACFALLGVGFLVGRSGIYLFELAGFFYSATWPVFMCVLMGYYKENAAIASSVVILIEGVIIMPLGSIQGWMNEHLGKRWALESSLYFCVVGALLLWCVERSQKKKERKELPVKEISMNEMPVKEIPEVVVSGVEEKVVEENGIVEKAVDEKSNAINMEVIPVMTVNPVSQSVE